jgi:predicted metal-binding membrane protein
MAARTDAGEGARAMSGLLERALRRDRTLVTIGLVVVILAAWAYTLLGVGMEMSAIEMSEPRLLPPAETGAPMGAMAMMAPAAWSLGYAAVMFLMWWVMMVAMMLPSAAPMILLHTRVAAQAKGRGRAVGASGVFALGYLLAWAGFSLVAVGLHWGLERLDAISSMMALRDPRVGGVLLIAAGLYQMTPLKHACLRHCRSPVAYLAEHWRPGRRGALVMGAEHGAFCLGCCWMLMVLLFYGGVMNLYWVGGLAFYVLVEKLLPAGRYTAYAGGAMLIVWGAMVLAVGW